MDKFVQYSDGFLKMARIMDRNSTKWFLEYQRTHNGPVFKWFFKFTGLSKTIIKSMVSMVCYSDEV